MAFGNSSERAQKDLVERSAKFLQPGAIVRAAGFAFARTVFGTPRRGVLVTEKGRVVVVSLNLLGRPTRRLASEHVTTLRAEEAEVRGGTALVTVGSQMLIFSSREFDRLCQVAAQVYSERVPADRPLGAEDSVQR